MKERLNSTPLWLINLLTIIPGLISIFTFLVAVVRSTMGQFTNKGLILTTAVASLAFILILISRIKKYRKLALIRMQETSNCYHKFLHDVRDIYFDVMHSHKKGTLNVDELSHIYMAAMPTMLDKLCAILKSFTGQEISACIKLISYNDDDEVIDAHNAKLVTFCRSTNSDTNRKMYEGATEILLKDNTDFSEIVSPEYNKNYFYQGDLESYQKSLFTQGRSYNNSNKFWANFYKGTIVVPIQIEFKRLYHQKKDNSWHIIGFLCVDSLSKDAFTDKQEKYNVDILRSFADAMYILLGQYRHYLKMLTKSSI